MARSCVACLAATLALLCLAAPALANQATLPMAANLYVASKVRTFTSSDCTNFFNGIGVQLAVLTTGVGPSYTTNYYSGYTCNITTGSAVPSIMHLTIKFETDGFPTPLQNITEPYLNKTSIWQDFMSTLSPGCQAEGMYFAPATGVTMYAGPGPNNNTVLGPGIAPKFVVNMGACNPPSPMPPPPPPPSPPPVCTAVLSVRGTGAPIPYVAPTDNCMRMYFAAQPFAAAVGLLLTPWCTDLGTVSGVVSFNQPLLTPMMYNTLVGQLQLSNMSLAIVNALNLTACTASVSISPLSCQANSPSFTVSSATRPALFTCPSPPPPPPFSPPPPPCNCRSPPPSETIRQSPPPTDALRQSPPPSGWHRKLKE